MCRFWEQGLTQVLAREGWVRSWEKPELRLAQIPVCENTYLLSAMAQFPKILYFLTTTASLHLPFWSQCSLQGP